MIFFFTINQTERLIDVKANRLKLHRQLEWQLNFKKKSEKIKEATVSDDEVKDEDDD